MMWWGQGNGWGYVGMSFAMIGFLALIVWAVVSMGRADSQSASNAVHDDSGDTSTAGAERILAERFARGEIDSDEYHRRAGVLHQPHLAGTTLQLSRRRGV